MKTLTIAIGLVTFSIGLGLTLPEFYATILCYIALYAIVCIGIVLLSGISGIISFGQAAFVGISAYACAIAATRLGMSPWLGLFVALAVAGVCAWLLAIVTLRLSGHYLSLGTISWAMGLFIVFGNLEITGRFTGLSGIPPLAIGSYAMLTAARNLPFILICLGLVVWTAHNVLTSRSGRVLRALNGQAVMAEAMGVNTAQYRMKAFIYAALLAAFSGWLYAHFQRFVNPTPFGLNMGIDYLFMVVLGGITSLAGALLGPAVMLGLDQVLQDVLPGIVGESGQFEPIVLSLIIILLLRFMPDGISPKLMSLASSVRRTDGTRPGARRVDEGGGLSSEAISVEGRDRLKVTGATKRFGGLIAVNGVDFEVGAQEIVALIGPNGAGKSTMFNLITGVLELNDGSVTFGEQRIDGLPSRAIAEKGIARTFQHVRLLPDRPVIENVMLGAHRLGSSGFLKNALRLDRLEEGKLREFAERALNETGLEEFRSTAAGQLALGQQRIVEIARALVLSPSLLLLDEPAAGLRYREKQELAALLQRLRSRGMSVLLVEHDMDFVMNLADRIVVMEHGTRIAEGDPAAIQKNPRVLEAYLGGVA